MYLYFKSTCYHVHFQDITLSKEQLSFKKNNKEPQTFLKGGFYQLLMEVGFLKYSNYSHKIKFKPNPRAEVKHIQIKERTT